MTTRRAGAGSVALLLIVLIAYLANGRTLGAGDTLPAAYLPWALLQQRTFDLAEFRDLYAGPAYQTFPLLDGIPYYLQRRNGHYLSAYGPGPGVLAVPVYAPFLLAGFKPEPLWADRLEKISAAIITALSAVILYRALALVTSGGWAVVISLVYALGTSSFSVSSQGLWQHGPSQLFLSLALYCVVKGRSDDRYLGYAGLPMAAAVGMRVTDVVLVLPVALWIIYAHRRRGRDLVLWALGPGMALALYHVVYVGLSDRGLGHTSAPAWALFVQTPWSEGLPGVLVSPSRGLFVYSPVLLFSLIGMALIWRRGPASFRALCVGPPLVVLLVGKWVTWWGGHSWGPRLLADVVPILCFFLYPVVPLLDRRRLVKGLFVLLSLWSIGAHALGAWLYDRRWDSAVTEAAYARLWPWSGSPLDFYGREALLRGSRLLWPWQGSPEASGTAAHSLAATYEVGPAPGKVGSGERFVLALAARNVGTDAWRAGLPGERGTVVLVWRWFRGDREVAVGSEFLLSDVPPAGTVTFSVKVVAPPAPGEYTLVLDLVSHLVAWFADRGQRPVRLPVQVVPPDIAHALSMPLVATGSAPVVTISTDRPSYRRGETLGLTVVDEYPHRPRNLDVYLVLEGPDGVALFFDGHTMPRRAEAAWPPWVRNLPLPARASGRFNLPLSSFGPGAYRWHAMVTEPGAYRAVARAAVAFTIEP